jgi:hypothetical protein
MKSVLKHLAIAQYVDNRRGRWCRNLNRRVLLSATSLDTNGPGGEPTLQGAIRSGSTEFEKEKANIVLDTPEADEAKRPLGDIVMSLHTTLEI